MEKGWNNKQKKIMEITNDMIMAQAKDYVEHLFTCPECLDEQFKSLFKEAYIKGALWMRGASKLEANAPKNTRDDNKMYVEAPEVEDWEQRRYEIAKQMMATIYLDEGQEARSGRHGLDFEFQSYEGCAKEAVAFADALITELVNNPKE